MPSRQFFKRRFTGSTVGVSGGGGSSPPTIITGNVSAGEGPTSGTTITRGVDATGANCLFVHYYAECAGAISGVSATYNGVTMVEEYRHSLFGGVVFQGCFSIINPSTGTNNAVVTITGTTLNHSVIGCTPMSGVNTSTPTGTAATASGNSGTATVSVSSATNEIVLGFVNCRAAQVITPAGGQTIVWNVEETSDTVEFQLTSQTGATTSNPTWTFAAVTWACEAQGVKP